MNSQWRQSSKITAVLLTSLLLPSSTVFSFHLGHGTDLLMNFSLPLQEVNDSLMVDRNANRHDDRM